MKSITVTTLDTLGEKTIKRWQELWDESSSAHLHNSPQWFVASCKAFAIQKYVIFLVENEGRLDAVFPLVWEKRFGITALANPGERFTDKSTLLLRNKNSHVLKALMKELTNFENLYLEEFSEELSTLLLKTKTGLVKQQAAINPYLPLDADPFQYMSPKNKSKMNNKVKKNREDLNYRFYTGDPEGLEIAFAIDKKSYKYEKGMSDIAGEREKNFYRLLLKECGKDFVVDIVSYKGTPFIYSIGFIHKKTYHAGITAYNKNYSFLSPGKIIQYFLLQRLKNEQIEMFDFSRGVNDFKKDFTPFIPYQYDILFSKHSWIIMWWKLANFLYNYVYEHKILYNTYLIFKKLIIYR